MPTNEMAYLVGPMYVSMDSGTTNECQKRRWYHEHDSCHDCDPETQARIRKELDLVVGRDRGRRIPAYHSRWLMMSRCSTYMG